MPCTHLAGQELAVVGQKFREVVARHALAHEILHQGRWQLCVYVLAGWDQSRDAGRLDVK